MALTVTPLGGTPSSPHPPGSERWLLCKVAFDSSYPTGGELVTATTFGLNRLDAVIPCGISLVGRGVTYLASTGALKVYVTSTAVEVADTTDLSADSVQVIAVGI